MSCSATCRRGCWAAACAGPSAGDRGGAGASPARSGCAARGGPRHPGDRRQQHGGRDPRRVGGARPRPARLHPGAVRRRRAAAWLRPGRPAGHRHRADPAGARACSAPRACSPPTLRRSSAARCAAAGRADDAAAGPILAALLADAQAGLVRASAWPPPIAARRRWRCCATHGQGGELAVPWGGRARAAEAAFVQAHAGALRLRTGSGGGAGDAAGGGRRAACRRR